MDAGSEVDLTTPGGNGARQRVTCRVCDSSDYKHFLDARGYSIVRCAECGLWFINPQPTGEELGRFYQTYDDGEQWRHREEHFNRAVAKRITCHVNGARGTVLDIGSGSGTFLMAMRSLGFTVQGVEPSHSGSEYAREHGIETFTGMCEEYLAGVPVKRFDVITLLNVLEHFRDPGHILSELARIMRSGAVLGVVVPDARFHALLGGARRLAGIPDPFWLENPHGFLSGFRLPDHLSSFGPDNLCTLLRSKGFKIEALQSAPVVFNVGVCRNAAKMAVAALGHVLGSISRGRLQFGYSTLAIARRE